MRVKCRCGFTRVRIAGIPVFGMLLKSAGEAIRRLPESDRKTGVSRLTPAEEQGREGPIWTQAEVREAYEEHAAGVRLFLVGVVRNASLADDLLQAVFAKLLERGHQVRRETLRGWLFQVAWNEVQLYRRTEGVRQKHEQGFGSERQRGSGRSESETPLGQLVDREAVERIRARLEELPEDLRRIVEAKVRDGKTLAKIAAELGVPLGTVASRFQAALKRLKESLS